VRLEGGSQFAPGTRRIIQANEASALPRFNQEIAACPKSPDFIVKSRLYPFGPLSRRLSLPRLRALGNFAAPFFRMRGRISVSKKESRDRQSVSMVRRNSKLN
jgi:hypothetical protein